MAGSEEYSPGCDITSALRRLIAVSHRWKDVVLNFPATEHEQYRLPSCLPNDDGEQTRTRTGILESLTISSNLLRPDFQNPWKFPNLTELRIVRAFDSLVYGDAFAILKECPKLQHCEMHIRGMREAEKNQPPPSVIQLPSLSFLAIHIQRYRGGIEAPSSFIFAFPTSTIFPITVRRRYINRVPPSPLYSRRQVAFILSISASHTCQLRDLSSG
ncbi:hypothetical protein B0H15DRAFT_439436 [Mycena belliarum]|uniref:Uncharacterized protein n=1 Tax=Mycena belliarum TaxID=1033014 RepID=A0AAD6TYY2_9AGAR|nr:hypothetical protein B0H15DRAFT_439436 [Mycena belliae]